MNTPKGNIMNRKLINYNGRNNESSVNQFSKEISRTVAKTETLTQIYEHRRKVFDGTKTEKEQIQKNYKKQCDGVFENKIKKDKNLQSREMNDVLKMQDYQSRKSEELYRNDRSRRDYEQRLQADNKNICIDKFISTRKEKMQNIHQDLTTIKSDYFDRNFQSFR